MRLLPVRVAILCGSVTLASMARGQAMPASGDRVAAAEAYDRGSARFLQRDYATAANWYETADRLAPSALALQSAIRAHREAGSGTDLARAATLALRLHSRYSDDAQSAAVAARTLEALAPQLARITVACTQCQLDIDGALQTSPDAFVTVGHHTLRVDWPDHTSIDRAIDLVAGQIEHVAAVGQPMPITTGTPTGLGSVPNHRSLRLPPPVFVGGVVLTLGVGSGAVASWLDALQLGRQLLAGARAQQRDMMLEARVGFAEDRTTALDAATAVLAAATIAALFFTRWRGTRVESTAWRAGPSAMTVAF